MCYSAQLQAAYARYLRETGAEMDIDQFVEIFGARVADSSIRIPRAVERWFDEPKNDTERRIKSFIDEYRAAETTKLEREVFAQKKRLADAERTLASKTTKAATESKRIAADKIDKALHPPRATQGDQAAPGGGADFSACTTRPSSCRTAANGSFVSPATIAASPARWRSSIASYPASTTRGATASASTGRNLFGVSHAVMLVDSFFENVEREGKNQVLHFVPKPAGTMLIACLVRPVARSQGWHAPALFCRDHR